MKLWGGRFTKETDALVHEFNASILFDQRLYKYDIQGSIAHVKMLAKQDIIKNDECKKIVKGLESILQDLDEGTLEIDFAQEDIHSFIESTLIERIGETGKKLHTGRSRNDQVLLDMKLYTRDEIKIVDELLYNFLKTLIKVIKEHTKTILPGFTHLQKAQPTTLAHHFMAYFEMFKRDRSRLKDLYHRMDEMPLGSGALAGTSFPIDREYVAKELGFKNITLNSMDTVADRDFLIELLNGLSITMMHLSRFCEELIIWSSNEYQFVEIDDAYSTGSSIMPQKKNPDIAELIRGKTGRIYGALISLLTTLKGLPLAYNKDMQEDKELVFDAIDTVKTSLKLFAPMIETLNFNKENMYKSCQNGFTNATDVADYLVTKNIAFRDAHHIVGQLVLYCIDKRKSLDNLSLDEYKSINPIFENDIYEAIKLENCVEKRNSIGGPATTAIKKVIAINETYLSNSNI
ncbi:MAG: argininosuccinate lyase [Eubacteriales bacterium]